MSLSTSTDASFTDVLRARLTGRTGDRAMTFVSGGPNPDEHLTFLDLDRRAMAMAALLQQDCAPGSRVLLLYPPGIDYVATFLACQYAGMIAVPAYPPDLGRLGRSLARLGRIVANAGAGALAAPRQVSAAGAELLTRGTAPLWLATDQAPDELAEQWRPVPAAQDDVVFLQYTSGTTRDPRGVRVTHENLLVNSERIRQQMGHDEDGHMVSWLPPFHDMGLIGCILQAIYAGMSCTLMSPLTFVRSPLIWLRELSLRPRSRAGSPNFGYDLCMRKTTPQQRAELDLSGWEVAFCGAEPVRSATMTAFAEAFAPAGFRESSLFPCYGLAEATLMVSGGHRFKTAGELSLDAGELELGQVRPATGPGSRVLVSTGPVVPDHEVHVVVPDTGEPLPDNRIGEIWFGGTSVADGYWQDQERTAQTFCATLPDRPGQHYLRTGDLGFLHDGELYVTGRRSEVVIVSGRNFYPHDLEQTAQAAHPDFRPGGCVAFSVDTESTSELVLLVEVGPKSYQQHGDTLFELVRTALAVEHGVMPAAVVLIEARGVPKTSSGKVQRGLCKQDYLNDSLKAVARWRLTETRPVAKGPAWRRHDDLVRYLTERVGSALTGRPGDAGRRLGLDQDTGFMELGVSSALAVEIRNRLQADLGLRLPTSLLFDYPTISALAGYLGGTLAAPAIRHDSTDPVQGEPA